MVKKDLLLLPPKLNEGLGGAAAAGVLSLPSPKVKLGLEGAAPGCPDPPVVACAAEGAGAVLLSPPNVMLLLPSPKEKEGLEGAAFLSCCALLLVASGCGDGFTFGFCTIRFMSFNIRSSLSC